MNIVTKEGFAREFGLTGSQVRQFVTLGMPLRADGRIDLAEAIAWLERTIKPMPLRRRPGAAGAVDRPSDPRGVGGFAVLGRIEGPLERGAVWMALANGYRTPEVAARLAVAAGAPMPLAYALFRALKTHVVTDALAVLRAGRLDLDQDLVDPGLWSPEAFNEPDWTSLAAQAGEPVDADAWAEFADRTFGPEFKLPSAAFPPGDPAQDADPPPVRPPSVARPPLDPDLDAVIARTQVALDAAAALAGLGGTHR